MHYLDYNEKQAHGTADFPLAYYYVDEHHPRYHMPFHWHKETELLRVVEGQLRLSLDDREYVVSAGELIYIGEGVIHGGEPNAPFLTQSLCSCTHTPSAATSIEFSAARSRFSCALPKSSRRS